jgi:hypothetical protein
VEPKTECPGGKKNKGEIRNTMAEKLTFSVGDIRRAYEHAKNAVLHKPNLKQLFDPALHKDGIARDSMGKQLNLDKGGLVDIASGWPDSNNIDKAKVPAGLWLVGDLGVYLMSNGDPADKIKPDSDGLYVAYAEECDPKLNDEWYENKVSIFGGDDDCEFLPLSFFDKAMDLPDEAKLKVKLTRSQVVIEFDNHDPKPKAKP